MKIGHLCEKASMKNVGIFPMTQSLILQFYFSSKMPICQTDTVLSLRASAHKAHGHCPWLLGQQSLETSSVPIQCVHHEKGSSSPPLLHLPTPNSVPLPSSWQIVLPPLLRKSNLEYFLMTLRHAASPC